MYNFCVQLLRYKNILELYIHQELWGCTGTLFSNLYKVFTRTWDDDKGSEVDQPVNMEVAGFLVGCFGF